MSEQLVGYKIADYCLDLPNKVLSREGQPVEINERAFRLLQLLSEASPEPVSKQSLSSLLWQDTVVSEWSLFRLISDTRQLLGDDGEQQQLIHTARGIGFYLTRVQACYGQDQSRIILNNTTARAPIVWSVLALLLVVTVIGWFGFNQTNQSERLEQAVVRIAQYQDNTYTTFKAQAARRNELGEMISDRLKVKRDKQWEKFFAFYFPQMTDEELFVFQQIRGMTETGLFDNNLAIIEELEANPEIYQEIEGTRALQQHLAFWLNKFESVFLKRQDMCLLYVGVEDGVPYPSGVDQNVKAWLTQHNINADDGVIKVSD